MLTLGLALALAASLLPGEAAASRYFRSEEVRQAHALRARVLERVPGLAAALAPGPAPAGAPGDPGDLLRALERLRAAERENPFFHWAEGELRRRSGDDPGPAFLRAAEAARRDPVQHWLLWEAYGERQQHAEAERELALLKEIYLGWGLARFPRIAERLLRDARAAGARGAWADGLLLADRAIEADPSLAPAYAFRARALWRRGVANAPAALRALAAGLRASWEGGASRQGAVRQAVAFLLPVLPFALGVLAAVLAFRSRRLLAHDAVHLLAGRLDPGPMGLLAGAVLLPGVLGLGLLWSAVLALVVLAPYLAPRERAIVTALLASLLLVAPGARLVATAQLAASSPRALLAQEVEAGARGEEVLGEVQRWVAELPGHHVPRYYLGLLRRRRGELELGVAELRRAVELAPHRSAPWVALGNALYLQRNPDGALDAYARAAGLSGGSAAARINAGFIAIEKLDLERGRREMEEGFRMDPRLASILSAPRVGRPGAFMADESLSAAEVQDALLPPEPKPEVLAAAAWSGTLRGLPLPLLPAAAGAVLAAFWGAATWGRRTAQARACERCGVTFCPRCERTREEALACPACLAAAHGREGIPPAMKARRQYAAEQFRSRQRRVAGILAWSFPGAGHLYLGRLVEGLLLLLPALLLLSVILGGTPSPARPGASAGPPWALRGLGALPVLAALYAISALRCSQVTARKEA